MLPLACITMPKRVQQLLCRTGKGLTQLEAALDCPYVAAKSLQALNQAYVFMHARSQQSAVYMQVPHLTYFVIVHALQT